MAYFHIRTAQNDPKMLKFSKIPNNVWKTYKMQQLNPIWGPESHQLLKTTLLKILENAILATKMAHFPPFSSILNIFKIPKQRFLTYLQRCTVLIFSFFWPLLEEEFVFKGEIWDIFGQNYLLTSKFYPSLCKK